MGRKGKMSIFAYCDFLQRLEQWTRSTLFHGLRCKATMTVSFIIICQLSIELYPTVVRWFGMGFTSLISSLFSTGTPFMIYADATTNQQQLPMISFGILGIIAGIWAFFLPETLRQPLPDTIEQSEAMYPIKLQTFLENLMCKGSKTTKVAPLSLSLSAVKNDIRWMLYFDYWFSRKLTPKR